MDDDVKSIHQQLQKLEYQVKDAADNPDNSTIRSIQSELRAARDDLESGKSPRSVEDRVKNLLRHLSELRSQGDGAMDFSDIDELRDSFEDIRQDLRKLPNY